MDWTEIKSLDLKHNLHSWSIQGTLDPIVFDMGKGACFWDKGGKRYIDFSSQLMNLNTGYQHPKVVEAIRAQAEKCCFCGPGFAYESRSVLASQLAEITPGDLDKFFFTLGGAEANENAIKMARQYNGKFKILARWRSYHGATYGAITLTGDPRRPPVEPGVPGVIHVFDPFCYRCSFGLTYPGCNLRCAEHIDEVIQYENPQTIAAILIESVTGSNGIFVPPDGYMQRLREICDRYEILLIADEVMSGFGRCGKWFAIDNWSVVPDMITMAKGLTSGYIPLGAVAVSQAISEHFSDKMLWCGLTYNAHPLACATAIATIDVYREEGLIDRARTLGEGLMKELEAMKSRHRSVGDVRGIGLFTIIDLVKDQKTREPLVPWNAAGSDLQVNREVSKRLLEGGVYTFVRWNWIFVVPPLVIKEEELKEGLEVIDGVLSYTDSLVEG